MKCIDRLSEKDLKGKRVLLRSDFNVPLAVDGEVANAFREKNPNIPIRVLVFDVPMTHYGHVEKPRQLAGGLVAALTWLVKP